MNHPTTSRGPRSSARRLLVALAALVVVLTGCADDIEPPGQSNVEVDTPELREAKAAAGIEPCVPGPGGGELPESELAETWAKLRPMLQALGQRAAGAPERLVPAPGLSAG